MLLPKSQICNKMTFNILHLLRYKTRNLRHSLEKATCINVNLYKCKENISNVSLYKCKEHINRDEVSNSGGEITRSGIFVSLSIINRNIY